MVKVYFTVDTEIWCNGWDGIDKKFPDSFQRYIYGPTKDGNYGLPMLNQILNDNGLVGTFFVEPLFSRRFGGEPLCEIVGLLQEAKQDIQLHLHTEWVDEAITPILPGITQKIRHLRHLSLPQQTELIKIGSELLQKAGTETPAAFRAGSYALNRDTLKALSSNNILIDSSYNASYLAGADDISPNKVLLQPKQIEGVYEYPVTVYRDSGPKSLRHLQLTACSYKEMESVLTHAVDNEYDSVVIVTHNFELLNPEKTKKDAIMVKRLNKLCKFLDKNRDTLQVSTFSNHVQHNTHVDTEPYTSSTLNTFSRHAEQLARKLLY